MDKIILDLLVAYLGDKALDGLSDKARKEIELLITARENNLSSRRDMYNDLIKQLNILDELEKKEKLTQEEEEKLAVSLVALEIKKPGFGEKFKKWKDGKIKYNEYLKSKNQIKEELNISNSFLETKEKFYAYEKLSKQRSDLLKQQKALSKIRNKTPVQENEYYEVTKNLKSLEMFDIPNIIEEFEISINNLDGDGKKNGKNLRDYLLKNIIENLKQEKKDLEKNIGRYERQKANKDAPKGVLGGGGNKRQYTRAISEKEHQSYKQRLSDVDIYLETYLNMEKNDITELKRAEEKK